MSTFFRRGLILLHKYKTDLGPGPLKAYDRNTSFSILPFMALDCSFPGRIIQSIYLSFYSKSGSTGNTGVTCVKGLAGKELDCAHPLVLNNGAPIGWARSIMSEVCRSNRGSAIQCELVGKYQPYPVSSFDNLGH